MLVPAQTATNHTRELTSQGTGDTGGLLRAGHQKTQFRHINITFIIRFIHKHFSPAARTSRAPPEVQEARRRRPARSASPCTRQTPSAHCTTVPPLPDPSLCSNFTRSHRPRAEATSQIQPKPGFGVQIRDLSLAPARSRLDEPGGSLGWDLPASGSGPPPPCPHPAPEPGRHRPGPALPQPYCGASLRQRRRRAPPLRKAAPGAATATKPPPGDRRTGWGGGVRPHTGAAPRSPGAPLPPHQRGRDTPPPGAGCPPRGLLRARRAASPPSPHGRCPSGPARDGAAGPGLPSPPRLASGPAASARPPAGSGPSPTWRCSWKRMGRI